MSGRERGSDGPVRLKIDLAYVGASFHGWQIQPEHRSVQGELARALSRLLDRDVVPVGAGRTDRGVHARGQVAHLSVRTDEEFARVRQALPGLVPPDMIVQAVRQVAPAFNARLGAADRRYSYQLLLDRDLFRPFCWQIPGALDRAAMDQAAADLSGTRDFSSFCKTASLKDDGNLCTVDLCTFDWTGDSAIFHVRADRFLHHMVRNLVGTLVEIGQGRRGAGEIPSILAARSRTCAGGMAPPEGLFLEEVRYPAHLLDPAWRDPHAPEAPATADAEGENP